MFRKTLLLGLSTAAMSVALSGTASAQNTQSGNCSPTTNSGNVTPGGNNCTLTRGAGADASNSSINVTGTGNVVNVTQNGLFDTSTVSIVGNSSTVTHTQNGNFDEATSLINGNENSSTITQSQSRQRGTVSITGNRNSGVITQTGNTGAGNNTATVTIAGNNVFGQALQNAGATDTLGNTATLDLGTGAAQVAAGTYNQSATIRQFQNGNTARAVVRGGGTTTPQSRNDVNITQENLRYQGAAGGTFTAATPTNANNPVTQNNTDVSVAGIGQLVTVNQDGVLNFASASVSRGGANVTAGGGGTQDGLTFQGGRREGNQLTINQDGRNLSAQVSVGGRDTAGFNGRGNIATINQGQGASAPIPGVVIDGANPAGPLIPGTAETNAAATPQTGVAGGRGHSATLFQFGTLSNVTINQDDNVNDAGQGSGARQNGSIADVSQSAFASTISLSQLGSNTASLNQGAPAVDTGANLSGNNTMLVSQIDSGDTPVAGQPATDPFGQPNPAGFTAARNTILTSQAGRTNSMTVRQNAVNASGTVFQRRGTVGATAELNQGASQGFGITPAGGGGTTTGTVAGGGRNLTANIEQSGTATAGGRIVAVTVRQDGVNLTANVLQNSGVNFSTGTGISAAVSQVGNLNSATVNQSGSNAIATVDQRGTNGTAGSTATNNVSITQTGGSFGNGVTTFNSGNRAVVRQTEASGRSTAAGGGTTNTADELGGSRAGAQSAEAVIIQNASGTALGAANVNSATIEQGGLGQYAEISQSGRGNLAGIRQQNGATNSVAIIRQTGNSNTFFIEQAAANQFYRVVQTGGGNQTVTGTGPNGGITSNAAFVPAPGPVAPGGF